MLAELNHVSGMACAPNSKRFAEPSRYHVRHGRRHNPLRTLPSTDDMIAFGFKLGGFPDPQTLTRHTPPAFDSQFGKSISRLQSLMNCDAIVTQVSFSARDPDAQLVSGALPQTSPRSLTPNAP